ncbi:MAG: thermonuclease family protein [Maricaulaceae bacterium]
MSTSTVSAKAHQLTTGEIGTAARIHDGDTIYMEDGLKVRLSGMQAPKISLGREGFVDWPLGYEAKAALGRLIHNKRVQLYYGGERRDRYERALAQVFLIDKNGERGIWVQEEMIRQGFARVYTWPDTFQDAPRLYTAEREARAKKRGIWANAFYAIRTPEPNMLAQDVDSFQIVEGIITSTADVRGRVYLNFGADYKTDFTIAIAKEDRKRLAKNGLDPMSLEGAHVRVRGWVELMNGPMMWLDDAKRFEILDGK